MTLDNLPDGSSGVIIAVRGQGMHRLRLLELGLAPGTRVTAVGRAPLGGPLRLLARGCCFALRGADAALIELEERR